MNTSTESTLPLQAQLLRAASQGLAPNLLRFLRFLGVEDGEVVELQGLDLPTRFEQNQFAHAKDVATAIELASQMEPRGPLGTFLVLNAPDPAVATRARPGQWHPAKKGTVTTDSDIRFRRALFIDVDAVRPSHTSATEEEFGHAVARAEKVAAWLEKHLDPSCLGFGHSGNGASIFIALKRLPVSARLTQLHSALLVGLGLLFSDDLAKIDTSVCDAKRLCPAFGTTKRKGAPDIDERPHRQTGFACPEEVSRLDEAAVERLVAALREALGPEEQPRLGAALGDARPRRSFRPPATDEASAPNPFAEANQIPIASVLEWCELLGGERPRCPGCGESDQGVAIFENGLKCHHERCANKGVAKGFRTVVDVVMEARGVSSSEAVNLLSQQFGTAAIGPRRRTRKTTPPPALAQPSEGGSPLVQVPSAVESAAAGSAPELEPPDARVKVNLSELEEHEVNALVAEALGTLPQVYQRMGRLVQIHENRLLHPGELRPSLTIEVRPIPEAIIRDLSTRVCSFVTVSRDFETGEMIEKRAHPPEWCIRAVTNQGAWDCVRPLNFITEMPLLLPDGALIEAPGYHLRTGVYYYQTCAVPEVPEAPTQQQVRQAARTLIDLVCDFPFESDAHRSAWLAALLTPIARWAFSGQSPLFMFDANQRGSGKGLLVRIISLLLLGREMDLITQTRDEEEERKRITAKVLACVPAVVIDNIDRPFGSAALEALLTSGVWAERLLGTNDAPKLNCWVTWYGSGNNIQFMRDDTRRRTCVSRLNTAMPNPEERTHFKHTDLPRFVRKHRGKLYAAALTMLRGWLQSGKRPDELADWGGSWGSFDDWDRGVRAVLVYAGLPDPIAVKATAQDGDATGGSAAELLLGLRDALTQLGGGEKTAGQVIELLDDNDHWRAIDFTTPSRLSRLRRAIADLLPANLQNKRPNAIMLGRLLSKIKDLPVVTPEGVLRVCARVMRGERLWRVEAIAQGAARRDPRTDPEPVRVYENEDAEYESLERAAMQDESDLN